MDATTISAGAAGGRPGPDPDPGRERYRRRQRRRAAIAWATGSVAVVVVALGLIFGGGERSESSAAAGTVAWEMSSSQYEQIHKGEGELTVLGLLGGSGLREDEVPGSALLLMFPPPPAASTCSFWKLSDAPDHLVRLCFSDAGRVLVQKAVRAPGESSAETTLA